MIHLINIVNSNGYDNGMEALPLFGADLEKLLSSAYRIYCEDYDSMSEEEKLEISEDFKSFEDFKKALLEGNHYTVLQMDDFHIQYEYTCLCH